MPLACSVAVKHLGLEECSQSSSFVWEQNLIRWINTTLLWYHLIHLTCTITRWIRHLNFTKMLITDCILCIWHTGKNRPNLKHALVKISRSFSQRHVTDTKSHPVSAWRRESSPIESSCPNVVAMLLQAWNLRLAPCPKAVQISHLCKEAQAAVVMTTTSVALAWIDILRDPMLHALHKQKFDVRFVLLTLANSVASACHRPVCPDPCSLSPRCCWGYKRPMHFTPNKAHFIIV